MRYPECVKGGPDVVLGNFSSLIGPNNGVVLRAKPERLHLLQRNLALAYFIFNQLEQGVVSAIAKSMHKAGSQTVLDLHPHILVGALFLVIYRQLGAQWILVRAIGLQGVGFRAEHSTFPTFVIDSGIPNIVVVQFENDQAKTSWTVATDDVKAFVRGEITGEQLEAKIQKQNG